MFTCGRVGAEADDAESASVKVVSADDDLGLPIRPRSGRATGEGRPPRLNDLSGFLSSSSDEWTVLSLPAIAEEDESIPIGPNEFHERKRGEALHPAHESIETLRPEAN